MNKFMVCHHFSNRNSFVHTDAVAICNTETEAWTEAERLYNKVVRHYGEFMEEDDNWPKFNTEQLTIVHGNTSQEIWDVIPC